MIREDYVDFELGGETYRAKVKLEHVCLRSGTFSSAALDPEEYFGIYKWDLVETTWIENAEGDDVDTTDEMSDILNEWVEELNA